MISNRICKASCVVTALLLLSCSGTSGGSPGAGSAREHVVVEFSGFAVNPKTVHLTPDGNLRWVNVGPDYSGYIVFPTSISQAFTCGDDLQPYFSKTDKGYVSLPITGDTSERVQLPCPLAPGSYDYEIWLMGTGFGSEYDYGRPERALAGKIVVE